ncbi:2Fe-2S iron-sulfur cluster-binding protein [Streptomyces sp. enrichment culture]|uniref:(2Fe-2S)-binding protein n=1 Tax=Streptomyces sp. enrichment culture TaxID=1795815 RepID=UPI003F57D439
MSDETGNEERARDGGGWQPTPQGEYDGDATAFVHLPPDAGLDGIPLEAPGHGYVPPHIADPHATAQWNFHPAVDHSAMDRSGTDRSGTGPSGGDAGQPPAPGTADLTGQWTIPVARGDLPEESGEYGTGGQAYGTAQGYAPGYAGEQDQGYGPGHTPAHGTPAYGTPEQHGTPGYGGPEHGGPEYGGDGHGGNGRHGTPAHGTPVNVTPAYGTPVHETPGVTPPHGTPGHGPSAYGQEQAHGAGHPAAHPHEAHAPAHTGVPAWANGDSAPATLPGGAPAPWALTPQPERRAPADGEQHAQAPAEGAEAAAGDGTHTAEPAPEAHPAAEPAAPAEEAPTPGTATPESPAPEAASAASAASEEAPEAPESPESPESPEAPEGAAAPVDAAPADADAGPTDAEPTEAGPTEAASGGNPPADPDPDPGPDPGPGPAQEADSAAAVPAADPTLAPVGSDEHPHISYVLRVNGADRPVTDAWIGESLLYVLRERLGLAGAKDGCSQGECGACNVQVDGRLVASCLVPAATAAGSEVRTVEGLAVNGEPSDVQRALTRCGAVQCGFCIPGMAMTVHDLLEGNHAPSDVQARQALSGNLCRCTGYQGALRAVREVVAERAAGKSAQPAQSAGSGTPDEAHQNPDARIPHQVPHPHDGGTA